MFARVPVTIVTKAQIHKTISFLLKHLSTSEVLSLNGSQVNVISLHRYFMNCKKLSLVFLSFFFLFFPSLTKKALVMGVKIFITSPSVILWKCVKKLYLQGYTGNGRFLNFLDIWSKNTSSLLSSPFCVADSFQYESVLPLAFSFHLVFCNFCRGTG